MGKGIGFAWSQSCSYSPPQQPDAVSEQVVLSAISCTNSLCLHEQMTNFELGVRVPLLVRAPFLSGVAGKRTDVLAGEDFSDLCVFPGCVGLLASSRM